MGSFERTGGCATGPLVGSAMQGCLSGAIMHSISDIGEQNRLCEGPSADKNSCLGEIQIILFINIYNYHKASFEEKNTKIYPLLHRDIKLLKMIFVCIQPLSITGKPNKIN